MKFSELFGLLPVYLCRFRWLILTTYVALLLLSYMGIERIWKDDSLKSWFGKDSEIFKNQQKLERLFGSSEDVYIVYEAKDGDIFSDASLRALAKLHKELADFGIEVQKNPNSPLAHTREVMSLINVQVTEVDGDTLSMSDFIGKRLPSSEKERRAKKASALNNADLLLSFVSDDARYGGILVRTDFGDLIKNRENVLNDAEMLDFGSNDHNVMAWLEEDTQEVELDELPKDYEAYLGYMNAIRGEVDKADINEQFTIYYAGLPELIAFQIDVLDGEMGQIFLFLFVMIIVLLFCIFRHPSTVLWPVLLIVITVFLMLGVVGWSGIPTSSLTDPMILLVVLISVADAIHIISAYRYQRITGNNHEMGLSKAMSKAGLSCFLTTFTTVVGFGSLWIVKPSIPVANFGFFCAVGLFLAFLTTVTLLPIFLDLWAPRFNENTSNKKAKFTFAEYLFSIIEKAPMKVIVLFVLLVGVISSGAAFLKIDTNTLETFDESTYLRQAFEIADKEMGGTQNINIMLDLKTSDAIYDAEVLQKVDIYQQSLQQLYPSLIVKSISIVNILKRINQQFHGNNPNYYTLPETDGELSQLLFLFNNVSPEERRRLVSDDFEATRIAFNVRNAGSTAYVGLMRDAHALVAEVFAPLKTVYPEMEVINSGGVVTFMHLFDRMARSQVSSFAITLVIIALTLFFVFQSFSLGFLALAASTVPVLVTFGVMGWLGVSLSPTTMIIAPIILGIAVDDSVHLINKLKFHLPQNTMAVAVKNMLREISSPLSFTTLVLSGGLLAMLYSSDSSFQAFGYLSAIAIGSALIADLLLIPALCLVCMSRSERINSEKSPSVLSVDTGS